VTAVVIVLGGVAGAVAVIAAASWWVAGDPRWAFRNLARTRHHRE
jgi:hypothetical protein